MNAQKAYDLVQEVANPDVPEGLKKSRAVLLLWVLQHVYGLDAIEAYEHVCDGDNDQGIDGMLLEEAEVATDIPAGPNSLLLMQSKYPEKLKNVGENDLKHFVGAAANFESAAALGALLKHKIEPELLNLVKRYEVLGSLTKGELVTKLLFVTAGILNPKARAYAENLNKTRGPGYLTCYDVRDLAPLIQAFKAPQPIKASMTVSAPASERFTTAFTDGRVVVSAVKAKEIAQWPGIQDRRLFELNVRQELRTNAVRKALDHALQKTSDHEFFLAFHNGLTVVCESIDDSKQDVLHVKNVSVVNGAQSTVAFHANSSALTDFLKVVVKFVEVDPQHWVARAVAVRSNTQNPVNARNLRARDGVQLRLEAEFKKQYPDVSYVTRPDASLGAKGKEIPNDDAAQLLCAMFNQKPWLAIKRLSLFDAENYPSVFNTDITAAHIVFSSFVRERVEHYVEKFPELYRGSWQLTRLVAVYLVGQLLRANKKFGLPLIQNPKGAMAQIAKTRKIVDEAVKYAAASLLGRADGYEQALALDDFKVDFKREEALKQLAVDARKSYVTHLTVST